jgi:hypothetical protein
MDGLLPCMGRRVFVIGAVSSRRWAERPPVGGVAIPIPQRKRWETIVSVQRVKPTQDNLNSFMDFDHVIRVHADGTVSDAPGGPYAPELFDRGYGEGSTEWEPMRGYSGQIGSGPQSYIMHNSESIRGNMARAILAEPGLYVAVVADWSCEEHMETDDECECDTAEGWAVFHIRDED